MVHAVEGLNPQITQQAREQRFNTIDADGGGTISKTELEDSIAISGSGAKISENFDQIDSDSDGELTRSEMQAAHQNAQASRFDKADLDSNGGLDLDELSSMYDKTGRGTTLIDNFAAIDENEDGELSAEEISAYRDINTIA